MDNNQVSEKELDQLFNDMNIEINPQWSFKEKLDKYFNLSNSCNKLWLKSLNSRWYLIKEEEEEEETKNKLEPEPKIETETETETELYEWEDLPCIKEEYYFIKAVYLNNQGTVKEYIHCKEIDIHACHDAALRCASTQCNLEMISLLIENGANLHINEDFPLECAVKNEKLSIVEYLIEKGANVYAKRGEIIKNAASETTKDEIFQCLLNKVIQLEENNITPIEWNIQDIPKVKCYLLQYSLENDYVSLFRFLPSSKSLYICEAIKKKAFRIFEYIIGNDHKAIGNQFNEYIANNIENGGAQFFIIYDKYVSDVKDLFAKYILRGKYTKFSNDFDKICREIKPDSIHEITVWCMKNGYFSIANRILTLRNDQKIAITFDKEEELHDYYKQLQKWLETHDTNGNEFIQKEIRRICNYLFEEEEDIDEYIIYGKNKRGKRIQITDDRTISNIIIEGLLIHKNVNVVKLVIENLVKEEEKREEKFAFILDKFKDIPRWDSFVSDVYMNMCVDDSTIYRVILKYGLLNNLNVAWQCYSILRTRDIDMNVLNSPCELDKYYQNLNGNLYACMVEVENDYLIEVFNDSSQTKNLFKFSKLTVLAICRLQFIVNHLLMYPNVLAKFVRTYTCGDYDHNILPNLKRLYERYLSNNIPTENVMKNVIKFDFFDLVPKLRGISAGKIWDLRKELNLNVFDKTWFNVLKPFIASHDELLNSIGCNFTPPDVNCLCAIEYYLSMPGSDYKKLLELIKTPSELYIVDILAEKKDRINDIIIYFNDHKLSLLSDVLNRLKYHVTPDLYEILCDDYSSEIGKNIEKIICIHYRIEMLETGAFNVDEYVSYPAHIREAIITNFVEYTRNPYTLIHKLYVDFGLYDKNCIKNGTNDFTFFIKCIPDLQRNSKMSDDVLSMGLKYGIRGIITLLEQFMNESHFKFAKVRSLEMVTYPTLFVSKEVMVEKMIEVRKECENDNSDLRGSINVLFKFYDFSVSTTELIAQEQLWTDLVEKDSKNQKEIKWPQLILESYYAYEKDQILYLKLFLKELANENIKTNKMQILDKMISVGNVPYDTILKFYAEFTFYLDGYDMLNNILDYTFEKEYLSWGTFTYINDVKGLSEETKSKLISKLCNQSFNVDEFMKYSSRIQDVVIDHLIEKNKNDLTYLVYSLFIQDKLQSYPCFAHITAVHMTKEEKKQVLMMGIEHENELIIRSLVEYVDGSHIRDSSITCLHYILLCRASPMESNWIFEKLITSGINKQKLFDKLKLFHITDGRKSKDQELVAAHDEIWKNFWRKLVKENPYPNLKITVIIDVIENHFKFDKSELHLDYEIC